MTLHSVAGVLHAADCSAPDWDVVSAETHSDDLDSGAQSVIGTSLIVTAAVAAVWRIAD